MVESDPRFTWLEPIGEDPIGRLWQAEDSFTGQPLTIKILHGRFSQDPAFQERLSSQIDELTRPVLVGGKLAHRLAHRSVVRVLGARITGGDAPALVVMEPVQGRLLADVLAEGGPLPAGVVARIGTCVAAALHAAHQVGVVHGGVHPGNVLLTAEGQGLVMDFGVMLSALSSRSATDQIRLLSLFLAPEHGKGQELRPPSDVYSLGRLLVTMLTGRAATANTGGLEPKQLRSARIDGRQEEGTGGSAVQPASWSSLPGELTRLCARALAIDPEARPSAAAMELALSTVASKIPPRSDREVAAVGRSSGQPEAQGATLEDDQPIVALETPDGVVIGLSRRASPNRWTPEASLRQLTRTRGATTPTRPASPAQPSGPPTHDEAPPPSRPPPIVAWPSPSPRSPTPTSWTGRREPGRQRRSAPNPFQGLRGLLRALRHGTTRAAAATGAVLAIGPAAVGVARRTGRGISRGRTAVAEAGRRLSRPPAVWYASAAGLVLIAALLLPLALRGGEATRQGAPVPASPGHQVTSSSPTPTNLSPPPLSVPAVVGMTVADARELLAQAGLLVEAVEPTPGTPGVVISTDPASGTQIARGSAVTLYVGVPKSRIGTGG